MVPRALLLHLFRRSFLIVVQFQPKDPFLHTKWKERWQSRLPCNFFTFIVDVLFSSSLCSPMKRGKSSTYFHFLEISCAAIHRVIHGQDNYLHMTGPLVPALGQKCCAAPSVQHYVVVRTQGFSSQGKAPYFNRGGGSRRYCVLVKSLVSFPPSPLDSPPATCVCLCTLRTVCPLPSPPFPHFVSQTVYAKKTAASSIAVSVSGRCILLPTGP